MSTNIVLVNVSQTVGLAPATLQSSGALISQGATNTSVGTASLLTQLSDLTTLLNGSAAVTSATYLTGTVTITTTSPHGLTIGDHLWITVAGVSLAAYNGTWYCTVTGTSTFTYSYQNFLTAGSGGSWTLEDVAELLAMATTFFAQGTNQSVYVLELGSGSPADGIATLTSYITANPNSNYTPGAAGYFYAYLVPRTWDNQSSYITFLQSFESTNSKTYFFTTTNLTNYSAYTSLMKCAFTMIESPTVVVVPANAITGNIYTNSNNTATASATTAHGVAVGSWFTVSGQTPTYLNGTFQAQVGTAGTSLVYHLQTAQADASGTGGTLVANLYANAGIPATEFSCASAFYKFLQYNPSAANLVTPFAYGYVSGVTPFPVRGNAALLQTLKTASTNIIGTGAEGGISNTIILWGTTEDGHDATYWYSVDWVQINADEMISNAIINGSNNSQNPLYYDQNGINRLQAVAQQVMKNAIAFGLALAPATVTAVPFYTYVQQNPSDYPAGIYKGLAVSYTPKRGFTQIVFYINVTSFPSAG